MAFLIKIAPAATQRATSCSVYQRCELLLRRQDLLGASVSASAAALWYASDTRASTSPLSSIAGGGDVDHAPLRILTGLTDRLGLVALPAVTPTPTSAPSRSDLWEMDAPATCCTGRSASPGVACADVPTSSSQAPHLEVVAGCEGESSKMK